MAKGASISFPAYDDDYPSCKETYATLCIYKDDLDPNEVSSKLGLTPSHSQVKGEKNRRGQVLQVGGWFLTSKGQVQSKDVRRHIDWILHQLDDKFDEIIELQSNSYLIDMSCYWLSASGQGGPTLSPSQMMQLAKLELEIWFDIY